MTPAGRKKKNLFKGMLVAAILVAAVILIRRISGTKIYEHSEASLSLVDRTLLNYGDAVKEASEELGLPADYLLALIALECRGFKEVPSRYESHIFKKLVKVREGKIDNFVGVIPDDIANSNDAALKNLASSWGPFQVMGYNCLHLDIKIKQLRGSKAVYYGAKWIKEMYGESLDQEKFRDAFHIHNTGKKYPMRGPPRTHSRRYVPRGMKLMKEFKAILEKNGEGGSYEL